MPMSYGKSDARASVRKGDDPPNCGMRNIEHVSEKRQYGVGPVMVTVAVKGCKAR